MIQSGFAGNVAVVTGGGSGIGRSACQLLAGEGANVVVADINFEGAERTVELIGQAGGKAVPILADISSEADNAAIFELAQSAYGGVDYAFLNAGTLQPYLPFEEVSLELFDRVLSINLRGTFFGLQQTLAHLRPGGACVVTASGAGLIGFSEAAAYSSSKHGVVGLVRSAARAFAAKKLRVNAICPGMVLTPMNGIEAAEGIVDALEDPEYRGGLTPQHVAEVALMFLSRRSSALNGQAQAVDAAALSCFPPLEL